MKRCPECRRDYYDETLLYCLDDGAPLVEGPATAAGDEHATAILRDDLQSVGSASQAVTTKKVFYFSVPVIVTVALISIAAISAVVFVSYRFKGKESGPSSAKKITRLTSTGTIGSATISPDGKYVAYSAVDDTRQSSLWLRHIATSSNVQIVPPEGPQINFGQITFSPDSNYIYFVETKGISGEPSTRCRYSAVHQKRS
jgi:hypothetical protein